jgi:hypothetical protein
MSLDMREPTNPEFDTRHEATETLRLLATLPPPEGFTDRVHRRVANAAKAPSRRGFWSLWMPMQRLQFAGAALLVLAVGGASWSVYRTNNHAPHASGAPGVAPQVAPSGGFGSAGAERHPSTLAPIKVPPVPKKKPSASRAAKPASKPDQADAPKR